MHRNSLALFRRYVLPAIEPGKLVLEVGGITPHYRDALLESGPEHNSTTWITCDAKQKEAGSDSIGMSGDYSIDCGDAVYHYVLAGQVIEHVRKPWLWLPELARVTRHGGLVILISPISWGFHKAPIDCWRIWPDGMRALLEDAGLTVTAESKTLMRLFTIIPTHSTSDTSYKFGPYSVAQCFGGTMPVQWGVFVVHNTGVNLNSTAGNQELVYFPVKYESA